MKKSLTIVAILFTFISYSQSWKYSSGGDAFDGKYKTSYVQGVGTEFPYNKPQLTINKFDKNDAVNFYIVGAGYFQESGNTRIFWVFDNEPDVIYNTYDFSLSSDGKIIFFTQFNIKNSNEKISQYEFINKLKSASKVTLRVSDKYGDNNLNFSLRGSTKAINFIFPADELFLEIEKIKEQREADNLVKNEKVILVNKLLEAVKVEKLDESSLAVLESKIKEDLGIGFSGLDGTGYDYKSIKIKPTYKKGMFESFGYVDLVYELEDGSEKKIYGTWKIAMDAPLFKKIEEEKAIKDKEVADAVAKIKGMLVKYQIVPLKDLIFKTIIDKQKSDYKNKWELNQVEKISITLSGFKYNKFWDMNVSIQLNNTEKTIINKAVYVYSLGMTKKQLKNIGGKNSIEF